MGQLGLHYLFLLALIQLPSRASKPNIISLEKHPGGNKELRDLLAEKEAGYSKNFLFTILEVVDVNASQDYVLGREWHWKDVLLTRRFGYISN